MTTMAEIVAAVRSLRETLTEFVESELAASDEVSTEKLVRLAYQRFADDEWMREALIREGLAALIPSIAADVRHAHRTRARTEKSSSTLQRERIASVFEHVGSGVSKSILAMTRKDHLFTAEERETTAAGHLRWAGFHRAIADLHSDDVTPTGDLPPARVSAIWREHIESD